MLNKLKRRIAGTPLEGPARRLLALAPLRVPGRTAGTTRRCAR